MSLQVLDPKTSASVTRLKQDVDSPGYRTFLAPSKRREYK